MSVYTDLLKAGVADESARSIANVVNEGGTVTRQYLDLKVSELDARLAALEARLAWKVGSLIVGAMVGLTGIFALIVGWMVTR